MAEVQIAEAEARAAEAEARAAEAQARLVEAGAESREESTPARSVPPPPRYETVPTRSEPVLGDYEPFGVPQTAYVQTQTEGRITLRAAPRADARRVLRVPDGTALTVLGCQAEARVRQDAAARGTPGRWCFVRTGRVDGWAFDAYLVFA